ncbi:RcnB family protein [Burkholderia sp. Bp9140]|uniref:RcnB family protein n=1 Tax=Burkholderia sp. Bp9140 TaxID=2184572 RepID=UPI0021AB8E08|nr:RcnB family protein [Burkholderia sp. Bp9140]
MKKQATILLVAVTMSSMPLATFAQQGMDSDRPDAVSGHQQHDNPGRPDAPPPADRAGRPDGPPPGAHADRPDGPPHRVAGPVPHSDWHRGGRVPNDYRGQKYVLDDWQAHDLQPPPAGYQWLQVNGDFVLAAIATGVIAGVLLGPHH